MNISSTKRALLWNYVCSSCGYVESYVMDQEKLDEISQKGEKIDS